MPFEFTPTKIPDVIIVTPKVFGDERGYFCETYHKEAFKSAGINVDFVQDNHSYSQKNVLRGLHWQAQPHTQGKLVYAVGGTIWDVAVDIREGSKTYGQWIGVELSDDNKRMLWIPKGFAHGFVVLSDEVHLFYKCTNFFVPQAECSCIWNDSILAIEWPIDFEPIISEKDSKASLFSSIQPIQGIK